MAENIERSQGRGEGYKFDRGGMPTEFGPYVGIVKNNIDPARMGRLQVFVKQFANGANEDDDSVWKTVAYCPTYYGHTNPGPAAANEVGDFVSNQQSYGMWFTPPDLETKVVCFFLDGDPNQGFYIGCVIDPGINHMVPAIGASKKFQTDNKSQSSYFKNAKQLPVTEINDNNKKIADSPTFTTGTRPVHSYVAGIMMQQGLITDTIRGPITSNSMRESPSACYGMSTPGKAVYQGGISDLTIKSKLEQNTLKPQDIKVIARRGGHSLVMDDGNLEGQDNLIRIRTSKGHQITMSDDGDCFYIVHANGQTWIELGKQGTIDVFSTNSVNIRTQGTLNLHADKDINMYAGESLNFKSPKVKIEGDTLDLIATKSLSAYSNSFIGIKSDGTVAIKSQSGMWNGGASLNFDAGCINLNGGGGGDVPTPTKLATAMLPDTTFQTGQGWVVQKDKIKTIVTRAPTHEPYPYHNQGVATITQLSNPPADPVNASVAKTIDGLGNVQVTAAINSTDFSKQPQADTTVGSLSKEEVTGLMASVSATTKQSPDTFSLEKGIGAYGFTPQQLEDGGFLKPGTTQLFLTNPSNFESVLSSPSVWTGKSDVNNLSQLLGNHNLQSLTQNSLMNTALVGLKSSGVITGNESSTVLGPLIQNATKFGVDSAVAWTKGVATPATVSLMNSLAKNAQQAVNFVSTKATDLQTNSYSPGGYQATVERTDINNAVTDIIGNSKVESPNFDLSLFSNVPDSELDYTGNDPVMFDRINAERLSRGLSPLPYDRPNG